MSLQLLLALAQEAAELEEQQEQEEINMQIAMEESIKSHAAHVIQQRSGPSTATTLQPASVSQQVSDFAAEYTETIKGGERKAIKRTLKKSTFDAFRPGNPELITDVIRKYGDWLMEQDAKDLETALKDTSDPTKQQDEICRICRRRLPPLLTSSTTNNQINKERKRCSLLIFHLTNTAGIVARPSYTQGSVEFDLHGQTVPDIQYILEEVVLPEVKDLGHFYLITGKGTRSTDGVCVIKPEVVRHLESRKYDVEVDNGNPGLLLVTGPNESDVGWEEPDAAEKDW
ncbi:hypothetical protein HDV00_006283 [Rhizophlyctis rosea]|nr:hypothetical protein HDV00_006283 [Rhizophlyctis rosea]